MNFTNTIDKNIKMRQALFEWLEQGDFNFFGTANFNRQTTVAGATKSLNEWKRLVDRKILRRRVKDAPASDRLFFVAVPEHPNTNLHYHLLLHAPVNPLKTQRIATKYWQLVVPSGDLWMPAIGDADDISRIAFYAVKDCWKGFGIDDFIVSD